MLRRAPKSVEDASRVLSVYENVDEDWMYLYDDAAQAGPSTIQDPTTTATAVKDKIALDSWMAHLRSSIPLSLISIPGTHNSCARIPVPWVQCQSATLTQQLHMGIRYFDFRLGISFGTLRVYHGKSPLSVTFIDAVKELYDFLKDHPSEALMLQIKHEGADRNEELFEELFREEIQRHVGFWAVGAMIPLLGDVQGRIQLMRRFRLGDPYASLGIDVQRWADNAARFWIPVPPRPSHLMVQDEYRFTNVVRTFGELIQQKSKAITDLMVEARFTDTEFAQKGWYLNWCNALAEPFSLGVVASPEQIALGKGGKVGINEVVRGLVGRAREEGDIVRVGTILLDFVDVKDPRVVQEIVMCNEFLEM